MNTTSTGTGLAAQQVTGAMPGGTTPLVTPTGSTAAISAVATLDADALRDLARRTDPLGVLSIYADAQPAHDRHLTAVAVDLRNRFSELQRRIADRPTESRDLGQALRRLDQLVESVTDRSMTGRGRIIFAALSEDWTLRLSSDMPVGTRLVLDDGPFIHPLLELIDEGRSAGVALVSPDDVRMYEWRLGRLQQLGVMQQRVMQASHERAGQIGGGPAGQFHTPVREQQDARRRDRAARFMDEIAGALPQFVAERRWERILISGDPRWTEQVVLGLAPDIASLVLRESRILTGMADAALAQAVTERLHNEHAAHEQRLVADVVQAAHAHRAALGPSEVVTAINAGRVAHLIYDPTIRYAGSVDVNGMLRAEAEQGPGGAAATPEPRLTERFVARALETGARVSPVEGAGGGALADASGIAAYLRW